MFILEVNGCIIINLLLKNMFVVTKTFSIQYIDHLKGFGKDAREAENEPKTKTQKDIPKSQNPT
jgi:hypothetical protein